jgi:hypothetical protein
MFGEQKNTFLPQTNGFKVGRFGNRFRGFVVVVVVFETPIVVCHRNIDIMKSRQLRNSRRSQEVS